MCRPNHACIWHPVITGAKGQITAASSIALTTGCWDGHGLNIPLMCFRELTADCIENSECHIVRVYPPYQWLTLSIETDQNRDSQQDSRRSMVYESLSFPGHSGPLSSRSRLKWSACQLGDLQSSFVSAKRAVEAFPGHVDSKELLKQLKQHFSLL
ncbi:hypothetical protein RRG08_033582 [Elysia crispata]|uniref:Uncharacterized protein n=1 Tax=Elysia crispata TaxID=231223 RepID=A0AAE0XNT4_9GAST|nr:hypothetical protein RRG08_033582 [Elysia crispata]